MNQITVDATLHSFCACRLALGGPLIPSTKQPALYKIPVLPVGERVLLHLTCTIGACGAVLVQPFVALPVSMTGQLSLQSCCLVTLSALRLAYSTWY